MPEHNPQLYKLDPAWSLAEGDAVLIASGGADARFELEFDPSDQLLLAALKSGRQFAYSGLTASGQRLVDQLVTAEIVVPVLKKYRVLSIKIVGDENKLHFADNDSFRLAAGNQPSDLLLVVRTTSTYAKLLANIDYQTISKPHLFVDLAFQHTISVGPLVFPGETACIACLQGRVTMRWGDEQPPPAPQMAAGFHRLTSELVAAELTKISGGDTSLTNITISWNFQDRQVQKNQLLKVPVCPVCNQIKIDHSGALALPWDKHESPANSV